MLKDRFFYPLACLVVAAIVAFALLPGGGVELTEDEIAARGWSLSGISLNELEISPGSNSEYRSEDDGFIRLAQFTPDGEGPASIGVFATLGPVHERAFAGKPLRIHFQARANPGNPLESFDAAYFTMEAGTSGWTTFELERDWQDYSFDYTPPVTPGTNESVDLLAIFPGRQGERKDMDLASIRIEVRPAATQ